MACFAAALLLSTPARAQAPGLLDLPQPRPDDVATLTADHVVWSRAEQRAIAAGDVRLELRGAVLHAPRLVFDRKTGILVFEHGARLTSGVRLLTAHTLRLHLGGPRMSADGVVLQLTGKRHLVLQAGHLERISARGYRAERLAFTTCPCGPGQVPTWRVVAHSARLTTGSGAWLFWTLIEVHDVPVLPLPVLYLPLGDRRTGLLAPGVGYSGRSGLHLDEPFYLTLGRSWDATFTPGYYFGQGAQGVKSSTGAIIRPGVKGFEGTLELRYAPLKRTRGRLFVAWLDDRQIQDYRYPDRSHARGSRVRIAWTNDTRFDGGGFGASGAGFDANVLLVSDAALVSDLAVRLDRREVGYLRSPVRLHATPSPHVDLELGALWLQDLRRPTMYVDNLLVDRPLFTSVANGAPLTFQRLPEAHLALTPVPLFLGLTGRAALHAIWWNPVGAPFADSGTDGLLPGDVGWCDETQPGCASTGEGNGKLDPGEQGPVLHTRLQAGIARPFHVGDVLAGRASLRGAADGWLDPAVAGASTRTAARAYGLADLELHTALERTFGTVTNRIVPSLEWRFVPAVMRRGAEPRLDAFDAAVGSTGLDQLVLSLSTTVARAGREVVAARLEQAVDLAAGRVGEALLRADLTHPTLGHRLRLAVAWDWRRAAVTYAELHLALLGGKTTVVSASLVFLDPASSAWLRGGLDELFAGGALPPSPLLSPRLPQVPMAQLGLSVRAPFASGLSLRTSIAMDVSGAPQARPPQPALGISWSAPSGCFSLGLDAVWPSGQASPELSFSVNLAGLGGVSAKSSP